MKAFPTYWTDEKEQLQMSEGMDLRDYFAGKALNGLLLTKSSWNEKLVAEDAYKMADAMMKAREQ